MVAVICLFDARLLYGTERPRAAPVSEPNQTNVFVSGWDGYHTYRIPSLLVTGKDTRHVFICRQLDDEHA
jgi:hypothetical protein